jgi:hypothetical protein
MRFEFITVLIIKTYFSGGLMDSVIWLIRSKFEKEYAL